MTCCNFSISSVFGFFFFCFLFCICIWQCSMFFFFFFFKDSKRKGWNICVHWFLNLLPTTKRHTLFYSSGFLLSKSLMIWSLIYQVYSCPRGPVSSLISPLWILDLFVISHSLMTNCPRLEQTRETTVQEKSMKELVQCLSHLRLIFELDPSTVSFQKVYGGRIYFLLMQLGAK